MAEIENRTKAPISFSLVGDKTKTRVHKQVIPTKDGGMEVVSHETEEKTRGHVRSILVPPSVDGGRGLLTLDRNDLKALKDQPEFMGFVTRGEVVITQH